MGGDLKKIQAVGLGGGYGLGDSMARGEGEGRLGRQVWAPSTERLSRGGSDRELPSRACRLASSARAPSLPQLAPSDAVVTGRQKVECQHRRQSRAQTPPKNDRRRSAATWWRFGRRWAWTCRAWSSSTAPRRSTPGGGKDGGASAVKHAFDRPGRARVDFSAPERCGG